MGEGSRPYPIPRYQGQGLGQDRMTDDGQGSGMTAVQHGNGARKRQPGRALGDGPDVLKTDYGKGSLGSSDAWSIRAKVREPRSCDKVQCRVPCHMTWNGRAVRWSKRKIHGT